MSEFRIRFYPNKNNETKNLEITGITPVKTTVESLESPFDTLYKIDIERVGVGILGYQANIEYQNKKGKRVRGKSKLVADPNNFTLMTNLPKSSYKNPVIVVFKPIIQP